MAAPIDPATVIATIWGGIATLAAAYERRKASKKTTKSEIDLQSISDAKAWKERGDTMAKMADEYKAYFEKERAEHAKTRDYWHEKATAFQVDLNKCQEQIIELKARPDLTDVLQGIQEILKIIKKDYEERHDIHEPQTRPHH